ncbi:hypothetical protein ACFVWR_07790 [Leifsonia sp. NPDC058292]|uniref:hypothetical protein n=1 Tax=Leifsonia sp. NPDC058292 TaxID=3346428 RepID=UPI0036DA175B
MPAPSVALALDRATSGRAWPVRRAHSTAPVTVVCGGHTRSALEFYQSVFGGRLTIATYAGFGMPADAPGADGMVIACS